MEQGEWAGKVTVTGFLPTEDVGRILAMADAVALPFRNGGGRWNTSVHSALVQGTFVLTTSYEQHGYFPSENIYYGRPGDVADMRQALRLYLGHRNNEAAVNQYITWESIADRHKALYQNLL
jgi:glycosyltransferase involved in cell wall biosynthesis